jgi:hypothetical protein
VLDGRTEVQLAIQASRAVWRSSPVVVTVLEAQPSALDRAAAAALDLAVPLLVVPDARPSQTASPSPSSPSPGSGPLIAELERLGVSHALHVGRLPADPLGIEVVSTPDDLPEFESRAPVPGLTAITAPSAADAGAVAAAVASLLAAGAEHVELSGVDPRATVADVDAMAGADPGGVVAVGRGFGTSPVLRQRVEAATTGVHLPGGGQTVFDGKRYVALYGHPLTGSLGVLGEQGPKASVTRARKVAAQYSALAQESVVPAFEIIATVAAGSAGRDGDYSTEWDVDVLRPLVDAAAAAGIYVVLDLQPGREDFLSQATLYEELLREPHVGLAMDPEWRLGPGQKPLAQIGSVRAAELNRAIDWLAALTDRHDLPQKMVLLHQFRTDMITDRGDLHLDHDELAVIVQMDGDGTLGQKLDTWRALLAGAPEGLRFGWKNFYDEDEPTPTPDQTFRVKPRPWWVSYQ